MPWKAMDAMSLREEFVTLAQQEGSNVRELCRHYQISSRTAYKWLKRYEQEGIAGLADRSRRPKHSRGPRMPRWKACWPCGKKPAGAGEKLPACCRTKGMHAVPHPNTITDILRRPAR